MDSDLGSRLYESFLQVFVTAGIVSLCGIVMFVFIARMVSRRLAQDLDILKVDLSQKLEVHRLLHQYRADAIDKLYIMLAKAARETEQIVAYHLDPPDPHRQFKLTALVSAFHQLADHVHDSRMYFPDSTVNRLQAFLTDLRGAIDNTRPSIITQYTTALHAPEQPARWSKVNYDLALLVREIENLARGIIGLDAQGEPKQEPASLGDGSGFQPSAQPLKANR